MIKRLGIIFIFISVLFLCSCGIPSIYVPKLSDISITSDNVYVNSADLNSSLLRSGSPYLNIYYQIVPEGLSAQYPYSIINNKFKKIIAMKHLVEILTKEMVLHFINTITQQASTIHLLHYHMDYINLLMHKLTTL